MYTECGMHVEVMFVCFRNIMEDFMTYNFVIDFSATNLLRNPADKKPLETLRDCHPGDFVRCWRKKLLVETVARVVCDLELL